MIEHQVWGNFEMVLRHFTDRSRGVVDRSLSVPFSVKLRGAVRTHIFVVVSMEGDAVVKARNSSRSCQEHANQASTGLCTLWSSRG